MRCPCCNSSLKRKHKFCPKCGSETSFEEQAKSQKSGVKTKGAIVACILLTVAIVAVAVLLAFGGIEGLGKVFADDKMQGSFSDDPKSIAVASQSVVKLSCYDRKGNLYSTGSGFACFDNNVIVTNYHVIQDNVYSIVASTEDGTKFDVEYVRIADKDRDIAILETESPHDLTLLKLGNSNVVQKGEKVVAIGSPLGLLNSVSTGVLSGYTNENGMDVLQFTAAISNGSSGGALFNDTGEVLGITFASYEAGQNLNLAIPAAEIERVWNRRTNAKKTIGGFWESQSPTFGIEYVLENHEALKMRSFYIEGWVLSHNVIQDASTKEWRSWCTVYPSTAFFPQVNESTTLSADWLINGYNTVGVEVAITNEEPVKEIVNMHTGDYIRAKVSIEIGSKQTGYFLTLRLIDIEILN